MTNDERDKPAPNAVAGLRIGRYELVSRLATGGMGEVFLARSLGAGGFAKEVVIKRILPHLASDPGFVQRFIEEGKLVVHLRHTGIAQVLDMGEDAGVYFIAMEHVDGKDLGELMRIATGAGRSMPVPLVVFVLVSLLDALDYAHHAKDGGGNPLGIIHRDVSPSNVMVARSGDVKLLDFGIARATERLQHSTTGAIRGKYSYMSPQQASGVELDARADLFSVGVIAWELLTGTRPFDGSSDLLTLDRIRFHDPGPLRDSAPEVPEDLAAVVERLLAKEPEARYPSADAAAQALRAHIVKSGHLATPKELASWMEEVVATLPRALRDRSMQGMSVDEVLLLSLPTDGAPRSRPTPSSASPLPAIRPATVVASGPPPAAPSPDPTPPPETPAALSKRARFPVLLVGLNIILIALVVFLIVRPGGEPEPPATETTAPGVPDTANLASTEDVTGASAGEMAAAATAASDTTEDLAVAATEELRSEPEVTPTAAGRVAGEAMADLETIFASDASLTVRVNAPGALVAVSGLGVARAPRVIRARPGTIIGGRVTAPDHEPRLFEAVVGESDSVTVALKPVPRGTLQLRFFPAQGTRVKVNGKTIPTTSNFVSVRLPVGEHALLLEGRDGQRLSKSFNIFEGKTTSLGTLDLGVN